ncbi:MAG TPA: methyltransferase domain-containing protein [Microvirga sp.]|jgi:2-polyprenyl-6-hydroxyphenyl methylase/3-demethylubiquinone-9 3-methyltransferase|nr:methyltransferase domain-containing protein [Microvirga sp.]
MSRAPETGDDEDGPVPVGRRSYEQFAGEYAAAAPTKPHNALYERPATRSLIGDVRGLTILDAGCGPGINACALAEGGALVHAFDVTPAMVDLARERCRGLPVEIRPGDLAEPLEWLRDRTFDLVLCALALDYVADLRTAFREFGRVTKPGGALVFSMGHPMRDWMDPRTRGGGSYFETRLFGLEWSGFGEARPYVESFRRPLSAILNPLAAGGWALERVIEPEPLPAMRDVAPETYAELSREPAFLCIRALRR